MRVPHHSTPLILPGLLALALLLGLAGTDARAEEGILWLNHHDLISPVWNQVTLDNNGTVVFVKPKPTTTFPAQELLSIFVPTLPPGHFVTGMRVCYGIIGDQSDTEVHRLRLAQFNPEGGGGTVWPRYTVKLEDTSTGSQAPDPPVGGFPFDDPDGFVCADSVGTVCLDPGDGTIAAATGFQFGDVDDYIGIMAMGVHYDTTCGGGGGGGNSDLFSFEADVFTDWLNISTSAPLSSVARATDGLNSLGVPAIGFIQVQSRTFSADELVGSGDRLALDLALPRLQPGQSWQYIKVVVESPSAGLWWHVLGQVKLSEIAEVVKFKTLYFDVTPGLAAAIAAGAEDMRMTLELTLPYDPPTLYLIDHIRLVP